jgi:hypothetical protein
MALPQKARLDNPDKYWRTRNRLPSASTALGAGLRSIPGALAAGARNLPAVFNREAGSMAKMGRDIRDTYARNLANNSMFTGMDHLANRMSGYAAERRNPLADLMNTSGVRALGNGIRRAGRVLTRTATGPNRMVGESWHSPINLRGVYDNFKNAIGEEAGSMATDAAKEQILKRSPTAQKIYDAWHNATDGLSRKFDTWAERRSGYEDARKEWSDMDKMKPIEETWGGDPMAKAHKEMQDNIKAGRGAGISPDTAALMSPNQRYLFQQTQDAKRQALRDQVAQSRIDRPGIVGNIANTLSGMGNAFMHPLDTLRSAGNTIGNLFRQGANNLIDAYGMRPLVRRFENRRGAGVLPESQTGPVEANTQGAEIVPQTEPVTDASQVQLQQEPQQAQPMGGQDIGGYTDVQPGAGIGAGIGGISAEPPQAANAGPEIGAGIGNVPAEPVQPEPAAPVQDVTAMGMPATAAATPPAPPAPEPQAPAPAPAPAAPTPSPFITGGSTAIGGTSPTTPQPESQNINDWNFFGNQPQPQPQQQQGGGWGDWFRPSTYRIFGGGR